MNDQEKYLSSLGLKHPETMEELLLFDKMHQDYQHELTANDIDPHAILRAIKEEELANRKPSNVDFHKRTVLAAEIVYQLQNDYSLGHLKLQKLLFLCNEVSSMALHVNFLKQAMGPYDPQLMRSIDTQFVKRKWYKFNKSGYPKYILLEKAGEHKEWYNRYFSEYIDDIDYVLNTLKPLKTVQTELVGTIYACWLKGKREKSIVSDAYIISGVYEWHKTKKDKFSKDQIINAISWMKEKGLTPK